MSQVMTQELQTPITPVAHAVGIEMKAKEAQSKLEEIQRTTIGDLQKRQQEIAERFRNLGKITDDEVREEQKNILEAESIQIKLMIDQRSKDVGELAYSLLAVYDDLGIQAEVASEPTEEDLALINKAEGLHASANAELQQVENGLAQARANLESAQQEKAAAEAGFWWFDKADKIETAGQKIEGAQAVINEAPEKIAHAKDRVVATKQGIVEAVAQVDINKRERVRTASLVETFKLIRTLSENAIREFAVTVEESSRLLAITEKAYQSAVVKKGEVSHARKEAEEAIKSLASKLDIDRQTLSQMLDKASPEYGDLEVKIAGMEVEMRALVSREQELAMEFMSLDQSIATNKQTLDGLTLQRDTAKIMSIKVVNAEKTARVVGNNIVQMLKNTAQEVSFEALDKTTDKMLLRAASMAGQGSVASRKARNDAVQRHAEMMQHLEAVQQSTEQGVAEQDKRYAELDAALRRRYEAAGVDLNGSRLAVMAKNLEMSGEVTEDQVVF